MAGEASASQQPKSNPNPNPNREVAEVVVPTPSKLGFLEGSVNEPHVLTLTLNSQLS